MRLGIFGGTFNPIHFGHLINIEYIRSGYSLDKVMLMPARVPVHKELACMTSAEERLHMVNLAIEGNKGLDVSLIEINKPAPSYTIDTVNEIKNTYSGAEICLIIGGDSFNEIDTWKDYLQLLKAVSLIVMKRHDSLVYRDDIIKKCADVIFAVNPIIQISSTIIRERIKKNLSVKYLLPEMVADYIYKKGLFRN